MSTIYRPAVLLLLPPLRLSAITKSQLHLQLRHSTTNISSSPEPSSNTNTNTATSTITADDTAKKTTTITTTSRKLTVQEADEELRQRLEAISGDGGEAGLELEGGKPVAMKRGVRENMFRLI